ncbi:MAG: hypothetical protein ACL7BU_05725 [Candidatus Phlomobacter fragariae]
MAYFLQLSGIGGGALLMFYHLFPNKMVKAINDSHELVIAASLDLKSGVTCARTGVGDLVIAGEL